MFLPGSQHSSLDFLGIAHPLGMSLKDCMRHFVLKFQMSIRLSRIANTRSYTRPRDNLPLINLAIIAKDMSLGIEVRRCFLGSLRSSLLCCLPWFSLFPCRLLGFPRGHS